MEFLYSLLKVTSMIATGAFGALALLTKYKDDNGKITKWGKIALGGIAISLGISLSLYTLETWKAKAAAERSKAEADATAKKLESILDTAQTTAKQQEKSLEETNQLKADLGKTLEQQAETSAKLTEQAKVQDELINHAQRFLHKQEVTINEVARTQQPLGNFKASARFFIPDSDSVIQPWARRLSNSGSSIRALSWENLLGDLKLRPNRDDPNERRAAGLLTEGSARQFVSVWFYIPGNRPKYDQLDIEDDTSDLKFIIEGNPRFSYEFSLVKGASSKYQFVQGVFGNVQDADFKVTKQLDTITSLKDFRRARVVVKMTNFHDDCECIHFVALDFESGQGRQLSVEGFQRVSGHKGLWQATVPANIIWR